MEVRDYAELNETIRILSQGLQAIADAEVEAAFARLLGIFSQRIEHITRGGLDSEREKLLRKIEETLQVLQEGLDD